MIGQRAGGGGFGGEHRELEPHRLLVPERTAERLAASHIIRRQFDRLGALAGADSADADALVLEGFHDTIEAPVLLTEQIADGNTDIVKPDFRRVRTEPAMLVEFGDGYARRRPLDDEQRQST